MDNSFILFGVLGILIIPACMRYPLLLVPFGGVVLASVAAPEWASLLQNFARGAIALALLGYLVSMVGTALESAR